jgi:hypothetical protein
MDMLLALGTLAAVGYFLVWQDFLRPLLGLDRPQRVKSSPPLPAYRQRSRVRNLANTANAGSARQNAKEEGENVRRNVPRSPATGATIALAPAAPGELVITENELQQLAGALSARAAGATVEEAIYKGWGLKKGGGPSYRRAKELFDVATSPPQPAR